MTGIVQKLTAAKALIQKGWCKHAAARNERGAIVWGNHPDAVCWCATGALDCVTRDQIEYTRLRNELAQQLPLGYREIVQFNDSDFTTKEMVLAVFEKAINANKGKESLS